MRKIVGYMLVLSPIIAIVALMFYQNGWLLSLSVLGMIVLAIAIPALGIWLLDGEYWL